MELKGKKISCFVALPAQTRFFIPIMEKIREQGGDASFVVPLTEYPLELAALRKKLPFRYFSDYMTDEVKRKIKSATLELMNKWAETCYKWDGFSRWPLFKQSWFFEALLEEYFCMERLIEVERPDMFIVLHECSRWGKVIGHLAWKKSIPFVTFQEGDYYSDQMAFSVHTEYSTVDLLWGEKTINFLKKYKCSSDKMVPIGNTHIEWAIKEYAYPEMIERIRKDLNIPPDKKVVLFFLDIIYGGIQNKDDWQRFLQGLDSVDKEAVCIFKWHPLAFLSAFEKVQEIFRELYPFAILLYTYDPYKLLAIADYCVTFGKTTLVVEALAFGKPLFSFPDPDEPEDEYVKMGIAQTMRPLGNWCNLLNTIKSGVPADIQANVDKYLTEYFYKLDGRSVDRTIEIMKYILDVRKVEQQAKAKTKAKVKVKAGVFTPGRVSFVIPSGDDEEALLATLTSLSQNVKWSDWEVVIVVNQEKVRGVLSGMSGDIKTVEGRGNALSALYNKGAEASSGEFLVFMRPGIIYFKDEGLIDGMKDSIVGIPLKNSDMTPYCLGIGYDFNFTPYFIKEDLTPSAERPTRDAVGGGFIATRRGIFESVGGFDEEIANHLIEPDICLKAKESGIPIKYLRDCLGFNYKETFSGEDISKDNWKVRARFYSKWISKLPKDDDFLTFQKDLLKI